MHTFGKIPFCTFSQALTGFLEVGTSMYVTLVFALRIKVQSECEQYPGTKMTA